MKQISKELLEGNSLLFGPLMVGQDLPQKKLKSPTCVIRVRARIMNIVCWLSDEAAAPICPIAQINDAYTRRRRRKRDHREGKQIRRGLCAQFDLKS